MNMFKFAQQNNESSLNKKFYLMINFNLSSYSKKIKNNKVNKFKLLILDSHLLPTFKRQTIKGQP